MLADIRLILGLITVLLFAGLSWATEEVITKICEIIFKAINNPQLTILALPFLLG